MTTTYPTPAPSTTTRPITFAVGTMVRIQHNTGLYKIHSHAAWGDDDHRTPTCYNLTGPSGQLHKMVPVERLILRADTMGAARYADRALLELDAFLSKPASSVKFTHCWSCAPELSHLKTQVCPKCEGLKCKSGGCRCNWPYASRSAISVFDVPFYLRQTFSRCWNEFKKTHAKPPQGQDFRTDKASLEMAHAVVFRKLPSARRPFFQS